MVMTFKQIFTNEGMQIPIQYSFKQLQRLNLNESVAFEFDNESRRFLKRHLNSEFNIGRIYEPTLKKIAENIIILNRQKNGENKVEI